MESPYGLQMQICVHQKQNLWNSDGRPRSLCMSVAEAGSTILLRFHKQICYLMSISSGNIFFNESGCQIPIFCRTWRPNLREGSSTTACPASINGRQRPFPEPLRKTASSLIASRFMYSLLLADLHQKATNRDAHSFGCRSGSLVYTPAHPANMPLDSKILQVILPLALNCLIINQSAYCWPTVTAVQ